MINLGYNVNDQGKYLAMHRKKFDKVLKSVAELFKILAHPDRLRLIGILHKSEMDVGHLHELTEISQSSVSQHLKLLRLNGIVGERREGKHIFYRITSPLVKDLVLSAIEIESQEINKEKQEESLYKEMRSLWSTQATDNND